jgi:hypothetical protein
MARGQNGQVHFPARRTQKAFKPTPPNKRQGQQLDSNHRKRRNEFSAALSAELKFQTIRDNKHRTFRPIRTTRSNPKKYRTPLIPLKLYCVIPYHLTILTIARFSLTDRF